MTYEASDYTHAINEINPQKQRCYMQLGFDFKFQHVNDIVYCAYTVPYTYTAL